jgi:Mg/Co/Ni transporter MgtE
VSTSQRIYLARLAGLVVLDPYGDQIGRLRDAVLRMRSDGGAPRVTGLIVEIVQRRRIFVPLGRVNAFDAEAVILNTGTVSLKRFEQRPGELLALGDFLDRRVRIVESDCAGELVDVAMERNRNREWQICRLAVRELSGRLGRRGQLHQLEWDEVAGAIDRQEQQGAANLLAVVDELHPADLAKMLQDLSDKRRVEVATALSDTRLADVLEELPDDQQVQILESMDVERAADVLESMDPDDAADLLGELPDEEKEKLLELMRPADAAGVRRLLTYSENTAGALMTTDPVVLPPDATVAQALAKARDPELPTALAAQLYVCRAPTSTPTGRFLGIAHIQRLLREPPSELVSSVLDTDIDPMSPETSLTDVTRCMATYNLVALPIVDSADRLLGAVTVDDVLDHLLPRDWRETDHV